MNLWPLPRLTLALSIAVLSACDGSSNDGQGTDNTVAALVTPAEVRSVVDALPQTLPSQSAEQVELGRLLFWDPILSVAQDTACASCHHPDFDYSDGVFASLGTGATGLGSQRTGGLRTTRNSPTVLNTVFNGLTLDHTPSQAEAPMFWDSRRQSLESQAEQPLISDIEMRGNTLSEEQVMPLLLSRLNANNTYRQLFADAFELPDNTDISSEHLLSAIAIFERSLVSNNSPFDRFMRGDASAMSEPQQRGLKSFIEVGCANCHSGPMFSDYALHVLGAPDHRDNPNGVDLGAEQRFAFRTPSLRNLANTAPYAHSGTRDSLRGMLNFYVAVSRSVSHHSQVSPADLDTEARSLNRVDSATENLLEFLYALNDPDFDREIPASVPSGLPVGGHIQAP